MTQLLPDQPTNQQPTAMMADRDSRCMYDELFAGLSLSEGKSLSKTERKRRGLLNDKALIYGEVGLFGSGAIGTASSK